MFKLFLYSFIYWGEEAQDKLAEKVIPLLKADVRFASFSVAVNAAEKDYNDWKREGAVASKGDREKIELKNKYRKDCMTKLRKLAMEIDIFINGDRELALATGFPMVNTSRTEITFLPKPELFDLAHKGNSGGIEATWSQVHGTVMYEVVYSLDQMQTWIHWRFTKRHRELITGLPLGMKVYVKVRAIGSNAESDFSSEKFIYVS